MVKNRPTFIVENATPKVEKGIRAIKEWSDSGALMEEQIDKFTQTLTGPIGKLLRPSSIIDKGSNIKTIMPQLHHSNRPRFFDK